MATAKTETPKIFVIDVPSQTTAIRDATPDEIAQFEIEQAETEAAKAAVEAQSTARASALAKLAELGLTEEEIAAL